MTRIHGLLLALALVGVFSPPGSAAAKAVPDRNYPPVLVSFAPDGGSGPINQWATFPTVYRDRNGARNLAVVQFLLNYTDDAFHGLNTIYDEDHNRLYLRNPNNSSTVGSCIPGQNKRLSTTYIRLDCRNTTVTRAGKTLTVAWRVMLLRPLSETYGTYNAYLFAVDAANAQVGYTKKGTWTLNP